MTRLKTARIFGIATVFVFAVVFLSAQVSASTKSGVKQAEVLDNQIKLVNGEYVSPVFKTDFKFNLVGLAWQGDEESGLSLRFYNTDGWSEWYDAEDYFAKDGWYYNAEPILTNQASKAQYKINTSEEVNRVKLIYISTLENNFFEKWNLFDWLFSKASASSELNIIPRSDWEADEDWRFNSSDEEVWPTEYQWPEKFVIHHTAGNDGGDDPAAALRGVYYWHAVVLGWGDVGYNYMIDQEGNIYEGRYGGDGAVGAHVYRNKTCAKLRFGDEKYEANFNLGTVGIAILGDYQTKLELNNVVKDSLTDLIAYKAKNFEIEPAGESYLIDNIYPNIVGHRDLDCTDCPGKNLYSQLETIRIEAQEKYKILGGITSPIVKATLIGQSEQPVVINAGEEKEVWVEFRNDGNITWRNYKQETLSVLARSQSSNFYVAGWSSQTSVAKLTTPNVAPGEVGRFVFILKAPADQLDLVEQFELTFGGQVLTGTAFTITAQITGFDYAALFDNQTILPATYVKAVQVVTTQFKNRGLEAWKKGEVKLNIYDLGYQVSRFYDKSWPSECGQMDFVEDEVKTNELATFTFKFKSPSKPGLYKNIYHLVNDDEIVQSDDYSITRVDSVYQAELVPHNIPPAVLSTWYLNGEVKFKNTGVATWDQNVVLKTSDLGGGISRFKDNSWLDNFTVARLSETSVKPGEIGTFKFRFDPPSEPGLYLNMLELVKGYQTIQGSGYNLLTRVD